MDQNESDEVALPGNLSDNPMIAIASSLSLHGVLLPIVTSAWLAMLRIFHDFQDMKIDPRIRDFQMFRCAASMSASWHRV
jgi:fumarate reductase subunit D